MLKTGNQYLNSSIRKPGKSFDMFDFLLMKYKLNLSSVL
jgi:hypothetical protein